MNEKLDLTKILKDCPKGTKLYSTVFGDVVFEKIVNGRYPILVRIDRYLTESFTADGKSLSILMESAHYSQAKASAIGQSSPLLGIRRRSLTQIPCSRLTGCW